MTMNLLSIGDQIECGTYKLHSRFARAANFIAGNQMVFVVAPEIGGGPLNIVRSELDARTPAASLTVRTDGIVFDARAIALNDTCRYRSELQVECSSDTRLRFSLKVLRDALSESAPAKSLAFLIDPKRLATFESKFEQEFAHQISRGSELIWGGALLNGIAALRGCGTGLTPSGDDFIAGLLIAMHLRQQLWREDWRHSIESAFAAALGGNALANNFLEMARRGCISERMKCLIAAVIAGDKLSVLAAAQAVFAVGATSGADMVTGFYMMMRQERGVVIHSTSRPRLGHQLPVSDFRDAQVIAL